MKIEISRYNYPELKHDLGGRQYLYFMRLEKIGFDFNNNFELLVQNYGAWVSFKEVMLPFPHRLRLPNEVIFEYDIIERWRAVLLIKHIIKSIDGFARKDKTIKIKMFVQDHYGKSPHLHCICFDEYSFNFILNFSKNRVVDQQINLSSRHMIRAEGGQYEKNYPITYSSFVKNLDKIIPITKPEDVVFPEI